MDFAKVAETVAGFLEQEKTSLAVAGAFALHAYGLSRGTVDLDFVTDAAVRERLVTFLESIGYETLYVSEGYSNHVHPDPRMGRVDFIYVTGETSRHLFATSGATLQFGRRTLPVPRAEYLAAMKVHAMKNSSEQPLSGTSAVEVIRVRGRGRGRRLLRRALRESRVSRVREVDSGESAGRRQQSNRVLRLVLTRCPR